MISSECYNLWISTRKSELRHPADSFRRVILAHLRGSDGRLAFHPDVEASILRKLRIKAAKGENPFEFLRHQDRKYHPSWKNSISKAYGHHEKLRLIAPRTIDNVTHDVAKWVGMSPGDFEEKAAFARKRDVNFFSPGISYLISLASKTDSRLSPSFVLPQASECFFKPNLPIFRTTSCAHSWVIETIDRVGEDLIGDIVGVHIGKAYNSVFEFLNTMRLILPVFEKTGQVWLRHKGNPHPGGKVPCLTVCQRRISATKLEAFVQVDLDYFGESKPWSPPMLI